MGWGNTRWGSGPTGAAVYYAEALIEKLLRLEK
jgi:hypothetical protein